MQNKQHFRAKQTQQKIEKAFLQLIQQLTFSKITVHHIVEEANVGRSTFYSHYLDKYDLLEKLVQRYSDQFADLFSQRFDAAGLESLENILNVALTELGKEREAILMLLDIQTETANLQQAYRSILQERLLAFLKENPSVVTNELPLEYAAESYSHLAMTSILWQLKHGKNDAIISFVQDLQQFLLKDFS